MQLIHIDVETRSAASLSSSSKTYVGSWKYSQDPSTDVWCVCWSREGEDAVYVWEPGDVVPEPFTGGEWTAVAHNYRFEQAILTNILVARYGWTLPSKYVCTMAQCAYHNLPMALGNIAERLGLDVQKDEAGRALMMRMANAKRYDPNKEGSAAHKNHDQNISDLIEYCKQDVRVEKAVFNHFAFSKMPEEEFELDKEINDRGIFIDVDAAESIYSAISKHIKRLSSEVKQLTGGEVPTPNSPKLLPWLKKRGYPHDNVNAQSVQDAMGDASLKLPAEVLQILYIRSLVALGSLAKFDVMARNEDSGRLHDLFQFCGASQTGRFAGRLVQIQNLPRLSGKLTDDEIEQQISLFRKRKPLIEDSFNTAKQLIRPMFTAPGDSQLIVSDLAQIECRVLAWIAGQQDVLDAFSAGDDLYAIMASKIFRKPVSDCGKGTRERQLGKAAVLGCGFGLGSKGFMENVWNMERIRLKPEEAENIVRVYREANGHIVTFWMELDTAIKKAYQHSATAVGNPRISVGRLKVYRSGDCILVRLPSGRYLRYWHPKWETDSDGDKSFRFMSSNGNRVKLWRGLATENVVQAIARDVLVDRMLVLRSKGFRIVGHVHDEVIIESDCITDTEKVHKIMSTNPWWADCLPLAAETHRSKRYTK